MLELEQEVRGRGGGRGVGNCNRGRGGRGNRGRGGRRGRGNVGRGGGVPPFYGVGMGTHPLARGMNPYLLGRSMGSYPMDVYPYYMYY